MQNKERYNYLLLLGGNLGDVERAFEVAIGKLRLEGDVIEVSDIYYSEAWGFEAEETFRNQVVEVVSELEPMDMLIQTQRIERELGRMEKSKNGKYQSRKIDIDLLFCNDIVMESERLTFPHPLLHKRRFTLEPLAEKWGEYIHPLLCKKLKELLKECDDAGRVWQKSHISD